MLSRTTTSELEKRLEDARANQDNYRPSDKEVRRRIAEVSLILIIGPWGIGKSHTINAITAYDAEFSDFNNILSRARRPDDPSNYRTEQTREELLDRIESGEIIQYAIHPTTGDIYATDRDSYPSNYVLMPTLYSAVEQIQGLGFKQVVPFGLMADGETWKKQLESRDGESQQEQRLIEAQECVRWLLKHRHNVPILENKTGQADVNAYTIVAISRGLIAPQTIGRDGRIDRIASELLDVAQKKLDLLKLGGSIK